MKLLGVVIFLMACDHPSRTDETPEHEQPPAEPTAQAPVAAPSDRADAGAAAADHLLEFRELTAAVAARTGSQVIAWGTAPLAEGGAPRRFAVLEPEEIGRGRGAYLIEDSTDARWLVRFAVDGRTLPWAIEPGESHGGDLRWQARHDRAIEHAQAHPRGGEELTFALRDGALVVLTHDLTGDADSEVTERQRFADDGECARPCPPLRDFATEDLDLQVVGPAATLTALIGAGGS